MNISSNVSSLYTNQSMMDFSANKVANINNKNSQGSQTDLAKEMTNQIVAEDVAAVNVSAIKTQDEMLGSLLDIKA